jgi:hypothetical protein
MRIVRFTIRTTAIREWREQRRVAQVMPAGAGQDALDRRLVNPTRMTAGMKR